MDEKKLERYSVAVIGAGPAGLFAARELAQAGARVALINRDIKAGGLAEYGIYPSKLKMKDGLRKQFQQVLAQPNIEYFGHLSVSLDDEVSIADLQVMGFDAILVAVGAQGTKKLGLPGEDLKGVYHAKDIVYHYNRLPPFAQEKYFIGKRMVCVGVGNVMADIAHWAVRELKVDQFTAIARRGPGDVKFTKKELESVIRNLDQTALDAEFERCAPIMRAVEQDPEAAKGFILSAMDGAEESVSETKFALEFLASPHRMLDDGKGGVRAIEVEETTLTAKPDGSTSARGLGTFHEIPADTVIFCIGDRVDSSFGLPLDKWGDFAKNPEPRFPIAETSYEAYNPELKQGIEGIFVAGWARQASTGLVGVARKDGTNAAQAVMAYLGTMEPKTEEPLAALNAKVLMLSKPVVRAADLKKLEAAEAAHAAEFGLPEYKFASNDEMLNVMGLTRQKETS
jgi:ferredoxin--NADP+ reductase